MKGKSFIYLFKEKITQKNQEATLKGQQQQKQNDTTTKINSDTIFQNKIRLLIMIATLHVVIFNIVAQVTRCRHARLIKQCYLLLSS